MSDRERLEAELGAIGQRDRRRNDEAKVDRMRAAKINAEIRILDLVPLVGVVDAVIVRYHGWDKRVPDNATGMLTKIARTRGSVDFGEHGKWTMALDALLPVSKADQRGYTFTVGGAK